LELNWSTVLLELVNFAVLVWILKHFLYKPVLEVIARRRAGIEKTLQDAEAMQREAAAQKQQYENRLEDWARERQEARDSLTRELDETRSNRLAELDAALASERERAAAADTRRLDDLRRQAEQAAAANGARFASRLLGQLGGEALHAKLVELFLSSLAELSADERAAFGRDAGDSVSGRVTSAFALGDADRARLEAALGELTAAQPGAEFAVDPSLGAGLRVTLGARVLGLNLADELEGFAALRERDD
jgi:F-type H+-transporting ATPase subunit b